MGRLLKIALKDTIPVMTGYLVLGFGFGIIMKANGFGLLMAVAMSLFIYAGSMQYVAIGLFTGGASLITAAVTTLMVNARHIFYGISMLEKYGNTGAAKPYLIFALTDETYSLVCDADKRALESERERRSYYLLVSLLDHSYWVVGTALGVLAGTLITFNTRGIDFALTALFLTVFLDQWLNTKKHLPALIGVVATVLSLIIFGSDNFLIPAMLIIALLLCLCKEDNGNE